MIYAFDDYELDTDRFELRRGTEVVHVEPQVFDVLAYLVAAHERVVSKQELLDHVWPDAYISEAALSSRLMAARKAIGDSGREQRLIRTVHGRGFRFQGEVVAREGPAGGPAAATPVQHAPLEQEIRFCCAEDGVQLAYATMGSGPPLVKAANWLTHVDLDLESPIWGHLLRELATRHTLIRYDERGSGLSDREVEDFSFDRWVCDLETVVDHLGLERFPLLGISQGAAVALEYTARHPERVSRLVLHGGWTAGWQHWGPDYAETVQALITLMASYWGKPHAPFRDAFSSLFLPEGPASGVDWMTRLQRESASPQNAVRFMETFGSIDVRHRAAELDLPVLVMHTRRDRVAPFQQGRRMATAIKGARFVQLDSPNHLLLEDEPAWEEFRRELWRFLEED